MNTREYVHKITEYVHKMTRFSSLNYLKWKVDSHTFTTSSTFCHPVLAGKTEAKTELKNKFLRLGMSQISLGDTKKAEAVTPSADLDEMLRYHRFFSCVKPLHHRVSE
jgi:hypothetical protein